MVFDEEFLNSLPELSEEELKNNFRDTDELVHAALTDFTTECDKIDREYGTYENPRLSCEEISLDSISERFEKVDFEKYRNTFSVEQFEKFVSGRGHEFSAGDVRSLMYGYTFTDEYSHLETSSMCFPTITIASLKAMTFFRLILLFQSVLILFIII